MTVLGKQQVLANELVRAMYSTFDDDMLSELIAIGERHEQANPREEIVAMNHALRAEIERRNSERP